MKKWIAIILTLVLFITTLPAAVPVAHAQEANASDQETAGDGGWIFRRSWGGEGDFIYGASGIAIGNDGRVYVSNSNLNRILIISEDDTIKSFGSLGMEPGQFSGPEEMAIGPNNTLYIIDTMHRRIQCFDMNGNFLFMWGNRGNEPGQFEWPQGIAIDSEGFVYVTDWYNNRIQKFTSDGQLVHYWGSKGEAPGQFSNPEGITIDDNGNVYVVDEHNHRIQKFDKHGNFLLTWGTHGYSEGHELHLPKNIAVNGDGDIVVTDAHIRVFSTDGVFIRFILTPPERPVSNLPALSYDNEGKLFICNSHGIDMFNKNDQLLRSWGYNTTDPGRFDWTRSVTTTRDGDILVSDFGNNRIQVFSLEGLYLQSFGERNPENNKPMGVTALATNNLDDIYIAAFSDRIHVYSKEYVHKFSFGSYGDGDGQWRSSVDLAIDKFDDVYVVEGHANYKVHKFTPFGQFIKSWPITKGINGCDPASIATYNDEVFVACEKIEVFDLDGNFLRAFPNDGKIVYPKGLEIDSNGRLYVFSRLTEEIFILNKNGEILSQFGGRGSQIGQFSYANDIRYHDNSLIIADSGNYRIQVFSLGTPPPDGYSGLAQNGSFEASPTISEWITGGNFPAALSDNASHGQKALVLGHVAPGRTPQEQGKAFAYSNFYVDPNWTRPVLSFDYNMFANDVKAWSDFFVEVLDGVGLNHLATVLHDGFEPCIPGVAPNPGQNLGWRSVEFDLSAFKGQHIRLKFTVQNRWPNAWGLWTHVDNVRVLDYGAAPLPPGPFNISLPLVSTYHCDPIGKGEPLFRNLPLAD